MDSTLKEGRFQRGKGGQARRANLEEVEGSMRGQHSKKMKRSAQGDWDPRKGQEPFRPNRKGAGDRTTTLRRLLIKRKK